MDIFYKIRQCTNYASLYALEEDFNKIGLTVQPTHRNHMVLCKIIDHKPVAEKIIEDYIFIGSVTESNSEIPNTISEKIVDFVANNPGQSSKVLNLARVWRNGLRMYSSSIKIANEDVVLIGSLIEE